MASTEFDHPWKLEEAVVFVRHHDHVEAAIEILNRPLGT